MTRSGCFLLMMVILVSCEDDRGNNIEPEREEIEVRVLNNTSEYLEEVELLVIVGFTPYGDLEVGALSHYLAYPWGYLEIGVRAKINGMDVSAIFRDGTCLLEKGKYTMDLQLRENWTHQEAFTYLLTKDD